jgi:hypothetical protein
MRFTRKGRTIEEKKKKDNVRDVMERDGYFLIIKILENFKNTGNLYF